MGTEFEEFLRTNSMGSVSFTGHFTDGVEGLDTEILDGLCVDTTFDLAIEVFSEEDDPPWTEDELWEDVDFNRDILYVLGEGRYSVGVNKKEFMSEAEGYFDEEE